jgi:hypothetical protein
MHIYIPNTSARSIHIGYRHNKGQALNCLRDFGTLAQLDYRLS